MDVRVAGAGSVVLLYPMTEDAEAWFAEQIGEDALWYNGALAVENRFVSGVLEGLAEGGLEVGL